MQKIDVCRWLQVGLQKELKLSDRPNLSFNELDKLIIMRTSHVEVWTNVPLKQTKLVTLIINVLDIAAANTFPGRDLVF